MMHMKGFTQCLACSKCLLHVGRYFSGENGRYLFFQAKINRIGCILGQEIMKIIEA